MKSTMLTNWIAPTRNTMSLSNRGTFARSARSVSPVPPARSGLAKPPFARPGASSFMASGLALALAQRPELLERGAAQEGIRARLVSDRRGRRLAVVVARVDARLFG